MRGYCTWSVCVCCVCGVSLSVCTEHQNEDICNGISSVNAHHTKNLEQNRPGNMLKWLVLANT